MKIKNGQYINALKKLSNQHKLNPFFLPNQIVCDSLCNWFLFCIISEHCSSLTTTYVYIYTNVDYGPTLMLLRDIFMHVVLIKNTLWPQEELTLAMWLYRRSMSLKSWKNLEDRLVYIVVLLLWCSGTE